MCYEISFHVLEEIIIRLRAVSLLRFRSVSKAWKSLIESSDFIAAHSLTQPQNLLLGYEDPTEKYVSLVDDDDFPQQRSVHTLPQSVKLLPELNIVGSSHGLLCLYEHYEVHVNFRPNLEVETVVLWNPSIRKYIVVAVPNKSNVDHQSNFGFGVCPVTCDPKIVKITQFGEKTRYHCEAKLYTLSWGKWRSLSTSNLPSKPFQILSPQVAVDGFIYWFAHDPITRDNVLQNHNLIISFDTTVENFGVVDLPHNLRDHPPLMLWISKLRESLVMLEYYAFMKLDCGVWMMEDGVQKSFTKLFTFEAPCGFRTIKTLGFRRNGRPIMELNNDDEHLKQSKLVVYEPNSKRVIDLEIYGTPESFVVVSYMETLVLLGRSDCTSY